MIYISSSSIQKLLREETRKDTHTHTQTARQCHMPTFIFFKIRKVGYKVFQASQLKNRFKYDLATVNERHR
jgi:hypothetical protein